MRPKLRFAPGQGLNYPAYTFKTLADVCEIRREIVDLSNLSDVQFAEYSMPAFDSGKKPKVIFGSEAKSGRISICGDVLLFNKLNVRKKRIWNVRNSPDNSVCSAEFIPVIATGVLQDYMYYAVSTDKFTKTVEECSSGTSNSQKRITPSIFLEQKIACPCSQEQQKIASFFTALDEKIGELKRKHAQLKDIKSGILNRLFSKDNVIKWKKTTFAETFKFKRTFPLSRKEISLDGNGCDTRQRIIHYGDILTIYDELVDAKSDPIGFVIEPLTVDNSDCLSEGDVVFADVAEDYSVGKAIEITNVNGELLSGLHTIAVTPVNAFVKGYLSFYFNGPAFTSQVKRLAVGTKVMSITKQSIMSTSIYSPDVHEQKKIVDVLSTINSKISIIENKIEISKRLKKAFMQQMFI